MQQPAQIPPRRYTQCLHCDHFVDPNDCHRPGDELAPYEHLEDGEQQFDHDAQPGPDSRPLADWQAARPDLFQQHPDGATGPNSAYHSQRGKLPATSLAG